MNLFSETNLKAQKMKNYLILNGLHRRHDCRAVMIILTQTNSRLLFCLPNHDT